MGAREAEIDRLYGLPLDEFTSERDELAARLRRDGDEEAAAEVKRLRKPTVSAWALNQVRHNNPKQVDELIEAGSRLRKAQEKLLGGGGRGPLDRAAEEERRLVAELARQAERELVAAGRSVSSSVQEKLRDTLHAAATDLEAREALSAGRLLREHTASGLGPLLGVEGGATGRRGRDGALARRAKQLEERLEQARAKQRERDEERSAARRELREARREATRAASALERAEAADEEAKERVEQAGDRVAELEEALRELQQG